MTNKEFIENFDEIVSTIELKKSPYCNMTDEMYTARSLNINKIYGTKFDNAQITLLRFDIIQGLYDRNCTFNSCGRVRPIRNKYNQKVNHNEELRKFLKKGNK